jgi:hypothetical protein
MSIETPAKPEVLIARKQAWHCRLWVRIVLVLLLAYFIGVVSWWWPRRTMVAVWSIRGIAIADGQQEHAIELTRWLRSSGLTSIGFGGVRSTLSWLDCDREVTGVGLTESKVGDHWLVHLKQFPKLESLQLHDRQVGPGLECLRDSSNLKTISVNAASNRHLVELQRIPQFVDLTLCEPQSGDLGLEAFSSLVNLKIFNLERCHETGAFFRQLPEMPQLEWVSIRESDGYVDGDLTELIRQPNLKLLTIDRSLPLNDAGLMHLSKLKNLERLLICRSWGEVTETGLQALKELKKLRYLTVDSGDLMPEQLKSLHLFLPGVRIRMQ